MSPSSICTTCGDGGGGGGGDSSYPPRTGGTYSGGIFDGWFGFWDNNNIVDNYTYTNITFVLADYTDYYTDRAAQLSHAQDRIFARLPVAKDKGIKAIVDVSAFVLWPTPGDGHPCYQPIGADNANSNFGGLVQDLISNHYLVPNDPKNSTVVAFFVADEPALDCLPDKSSFEPNPALVTAVRAIRDNPYTENFPLVVNTRQESYGSVDVSLQLFDWVSMDDYHSDAATYISHFNTFEDAMIYSPDRVGGTPQHFILMPLVSDLGTTYVHPYYDNPGAILNKYRSDDKVIGILAFEWNHDGGGYGIRGKWWLSEYKKIGYYITEDDHPLPWASYDGCGYLQPGEQLVQNQSLYSCDGRFRLVLQGDGNLVLYQGGTALWATHTTDAPGTVAKLQSDGNFVVYDAAGNPVWYSHTQNHSWDYLALQDDGNLVLYDAGNRAIWSTHTCCR